MLVTVKASVLLLANAMLPYCNVVAESLASGAAPMVPDNSMTWFAPLVFSALSVSVTEPVITPSDSGLKVMRRLHRPPGAREVVQSEEAPETVANGPFALMPLNESDALPVF